MIRFRATSSLDTNTLWYDGGTYTGNIIALNFTSSYSLATERVFASVTSVKYEGNGSWIIFETNGDLLPDESGQYDLNVFNAIASGSAKWGTIQTKYSAETATWGDAEQRTVGSTLLTSDRAFVSGSDYDETNTYNYQNNPVYQVYNG